MKSILLSGLIIYLLILIINVIGVYIYYKKSPKKPIRILFYYLMFLLLFQIITTTLTSLNINNLILSHAYFIIQFFTLAYFFNQIIKLEWVTKLIKIYIISVLCFLLFQYLLLPSLIWNYNIFEVYITNYLIILLSLIYFYENLGKKKEYQPFVIAIFIYSTLSTSIFLFGNVASYTNIESVVYIWGIHLLILIVCQLLITFQWSSSLKSRIL